jgi:DNA-binding LytR/AlgR family response regulator
MIDIQDGKRLLRVSVEDITAVHAAGNYVEFVLIDNRRPLARQSLSVTQQRLGNGFVRTHRSWVVNTAHVRELCALAAGDYRIELTNGLRVPLSRRFPTALDRLRQPPHAGSWLKS